MLIYTGLLALAKLALAVVFGKPAEQAVVKVENLEFDLLVPLQGDVADPRRFPVRGYVQGLRFGRNRRLRNVLHGHPHSLV